MVEDENLSEKLASVDKALSLSLQPESAAREEGQSLWRNEISIEAAIAYVCQPLESDSGEHPEGCEDFTNLNFVERVMGSERAGGTADASCLARKMLATVLVEKMIASNDARVVFANDEVLHRVQRCLISAYASVPDTLAPLLFTLIAELLCSHLRSFTAWPRLLLLLDATPSSYARPFRLLQAILRRASVDVAASADIFWQLLESVIPHILHNISEHSVPAALKEICVEVVRATLEPLTRYLMSIMNQEFPLDSELDEPDALSLYRHEDRLFIEKFTQDVIPNVPALISVLEDVMSELSRQATDLDLMLAGISVIKTYSFIFIELNSACSGLQPLEDLQRQFHRFWDISNEILSNYYKVYRRMVLEEDSGDQLSSVEPRGGPSELLLELVNLFNSLLTDGVCSSYVLCRLDEIFYVLLLYSQMINAQQLCPDDFALIECLYFEPSSIVEAVDVRSGVLALLKTCVTQAKAAAEEHMLKAIRRCCLETEDHWKIAEVTLFFAGALSYFTGTNYVLQYAATVVANPSRYPSSRTSITVRLPKRNAEVEEQQSATQLGTETCAHEDAENPAETNELEPLCVQDLLLARAFITLAALGKMVTKAYTEDVVQLTNLALAYAKAQSASLITRSAALCTVASLARHFDRRVVILPNFQAEVVLAASQVRILHPGSDAIKALALAVSTATVLRDSHADASTQGLMQTIWTSQFTENHHIIVHHFCALALAASADQTLRKEFVLGFLTEMIFRSVVEQKSVALAVCVLSCVVEALGAAAEGNEACEGDLAVELNEIWKAVKLICNPAFVEEECIGDEVTAKGTLQCLLVARKHLGGRDAPTNGRRHSAGVERRFGSEEVGMIMRLTAYLAEAWLAARKLRTDWEERQNECVALQNAEDARGVPCTMCTVCAAVQFLMTVTQVNHKQTAYTSSARILDDQQVPTFFKFNLLLALLTGLALSDAPLYLTLKALKSPHSSVDGATIVREAWLPQIVYPNWFKMNGDEWCAVVKFILECIRETRDGRVDERVLLQRFCGVEESAGVWFSVELQRVAKVTDALAFIPKRSQLPPYRPDPL